MGDAGFWEAVMERNLLIHSMSLFAPITLPILEVVNARVVAEIGAEHGGNSKLLHEWLKQKNGKLISIDCCPSQAFLDWLPTVSDVVEHNPNESLNAIRDTLNVDAWFVDGDHNWYTVYHELMQLHELHEKQGKPLLVFLHDVAWPWARRDLYYSPNRIPPAFCHSHTYEAGVTLDNPGVIEGGFRSHGAYAIALQEGGAKNGVLTAIDDFRQQYPERYCFASIPAIFGLGVLFDRYHPEAEKIAMLVAPYHQNTLLQALEMNRLDNYLKVIEWQDNASPETEAAAVEVESQSNNIEANDIEKNALAILNMLSDQRNEPDVFTKILRKLPDTKELLKQFVNYLNLLLDVPQEPETVKFIGLVEAVSHAKRGDLKSAHARLEELHAYYPDCDLILDAYKSTLNVNA